MFKGLTIPMSLKRRLPACMVILHPGNDELVPFAGSLSRLEAAARVAAPAD